MLAAVSYSLLQRVERCVCRFVSDEHDETCPLPSHKSFFLFFSLDLVCICFGSSAARVAIFISPAHGYAIFVTDNFQVAASGTVCALMWPR